MVAGNVSDIVQISKTQFLIARGMGLTIQQLADKYHLSTSQVKLAMEDMGLLKKDTEDGEPTELTAREQKYIDVCTDFQIEPDVCNKLIEALGLEYKTGRRSSKGGRKFIINDDLTVQA